MYNYKNVVGITVIFASPLSGYRFQVKLSYRNKCEISKSIAENFIIIL
jgi:hypothetical protein